MYYSVLVRAYGYIDEDNLKDEMKDQANIQIRGTTPGVCTIIVKDFVEGWHYNHLLDNYEENNEDTIIQFLKNKLNRTHDVVSCQRMDGVP